MKRRIALVSTNNVYSAPYLPLTVGSIWAYAKAKGSAADFAEPVWLYRKEPIDKAVARLGWPLPELAAFSDYIWNHEWNLALARVIKQLSPSTIILFGGIHVPDDPPETFFDDHPEIDFLIHGEGELAFARFLEEHAGNRDWSKVPGLSMRGLKTERKFASVEEMPSPYLDGTFDSIINESPNWQVLQETNRGC